MFRSSFWASVLLLPVVAGAAHAQGTTIKISYNSNSRDGNDASNEGVVSDDGLHVAFSSIATNLVGNDNNGLRDIFVRDWKALKTKRVSVDANGAEANGDSFDPAISADGRWIAFESTASNLVAGDANGSFDIFVKDRINGAIARISLDMTGGDSDGDSFHPALSADGRFVAFTSVATDLVAGDTNGLADVFVHDRDPDANGIFDEGNGTTERVSIRTNGSQSRGGDSQKPAISADGNLVAFVSNATNLVANDNNGARDVFVHDRAAGTTVRPSVSSAGVEGNLQSDNPTLPAGGTLVAFESASDNLVVGDTNAVADIFLHDLATGTTDLISRGSFGQSANGACRTPVFSSDGALVAFVTPASSLVPGDTNGADDVYVRDLARNLLSRASLTFRNTSSTGACSGPDVNADGTVISFESGAFDLAQNDANFTNDVFVRLTCHALSENYGTGLAGTLGIPALALDRFPVLGVTVTLTIGNSAPTTTMAVLFAGENAAQIPTAWGSDLLVSPDNVCALTLPAGGLTLTTTIANDPAFCGEVLHLQVLEFDSGAPLGVSFSRGLVVTFGF